MTVRFILEYSTILDYYVNLDLVRSEVGVCGYTTTIKYILIDALKRYGSHLHPPL